MSHCIHRKDSSSREGYIVCLSDRLISPNGEVSVQKCEGLDGVEACPFRNMPNLSIDGAGDIIHRITHHTGISALVHAIESVTGVSCGCAGRKDWMNKFSQRMAKWLRFGRNRHAKMNGNWAVAVTTAPRGTVNLHDCLASLVRNRWSPWIFAEPGSDLTGCDMFTVTQNETKLGAWYNWVNSCETVLKETDAEYILTVQDDTVIEDGAREWIEANMPPADFGMASLYTSQKYDREKWHKGREGWYWVNTEYLWGACAMMFHRDVLRELVDHRKAQNWRGVRRRSNGSVQREDHQVQNVDTAVSIVLKRMSKRIYFCNPSLSQHIGVVSATGHGGASGNRSARTVGVPQRDTTLS